MAGKVGALAPPTAKHERHEKNPHMHRWNKSWLPGSSAMQDLRTRGFGRGMSRPAEWRLKLPRT